MQVRAIRGVVRRDGMAVGSVTGVCERRCTIALADGSNVEAQKAASCLVEPCLRDLVLVYANGAEYYVLAVLERAETGALPLVVPEGLKIEADHVAIAARREVEVSAPSVQLGATELRLVFRELALWGRELVARTEVMRAISKRAHLMLEHVHSRVARSTKIVSELETTSAKQLHYTVTDTLSVHSKTGVLTAEELLKLDGKLVQLG